MSKNTKVSWTEEQEQVIHLRNRSLLVSAAAGSGKTAVLVERIISMVTDPVNPMDIDRLLVVTFTNAAASEMRERIGNALERVLLEHPDDVHLQRQVTLVHNAQITTIDSFCMSVIRNHFHRIDLEPGFRIADEGELKLLREDTADQLLEECYEKKTEEFLRFADSYSTAKSDEPIKKMILDLYTFSQSEPWPEKWLRSCEESYLADTVDELEQKAWMQGFFSYLKMRVTDIAAQYESVYALTQDADGPQAYGAMVEDDLRQIRGLLHCDTLQSWYDALSGISFTRMPVLRKYQGSDQKKEKVKNTRDAVKKLVKDFKNRYFSASPEQSLKAIQDTAQMVHVLVELTLQFSGKFAEEKKKKNIIDFSDGEHFALQVLVDPETGKATEIAREYRSQFEEIMIDEYQDSNFLQEAILTSISGVEEGRQNLFMVGDVKQSIYRFRLARPELFMEKYRTFSKTEAKQQRIDLHKNFRSRSEVLDIVNDIFYHIMKADLGNVEYDTEAALYCGASYEPYEEESCTQPECIMVSEDTEEEKPIPEIRAIAGRIRQMVEGQEIPGISYRDIVVLLRSPAAWTENFQQIFEEEGIPLLITSRTGYFSAPEVQVVLSALRVLDNPLQDIPLASVMKSRIGGFTAEEMARIKAAGPDLTFYEAVAAYAEEDELSEKLSAFRKMLSSFRSRLPYTPIHILLQQLMDETGFLRAESALPGGEQRRANLHMLVERAASYEETSYHGLYHFIRYIDLLMKYDVDYGEPEILSEQEDAVRLMSIHKSKGLEFPVVFLAGMGKRFNMTDANSSVILHPEYGIGMKWYDCERRTKEETLLHQVLALETKKENLGEELRVLYVAMTRAKEKLILIGANPGFDLEHPASHEWRSEQEPISFSERMTADCYWKFVYPALLGYRDRYPIRLWDKQTETGEALRNILSQSQRKETLKNSLETCDSSVLHELEQQLNWKYPYLQEIPLKPKVSVSEIKHRSIEQAMEQLEEVRTEELFETDRITPYVPRFAGEQETAQGAARGTAVHRFMECLDFAHLPFTGGSVSLSCYFQQERQRISESGRMIPEDMSLLSERQILAFLGDDICRRMGRAAQNGLLFREQPFVMSVPANRIWDNTPTDSRTLVQGIIDVFWEEEDGIVLLDYKTDRVETEQELTDRYRVQLQLYAEALQNHFADKKVKEILIYSFRFGKVIPIDLI